MRPPLKWAGGKRWQVSHLRPLWGPYRDRRLVESFCGGLAVTLGDVAGKGIPAALLMAKLTADVRYCLVAEPDAATRRANQIPRTAWRRRGFESWAWVLACPARPTEEGVVQGQVQRGDSSPGHQ